jgi:molybdopterin-guanine dinucleotide biosynthesis protein A
MLTAFCSEYVGSKTVTAFMPDNRSLTFDATCIILAGGRNMRMNGSDKAKLIVDTKPLLQQKYDLFRNWFEDVIVVCNRKRRSDYPGMNVVVDEQEGQGPLMGLYSGMKTSRNPICFVSACDMPFVNEALVQLLLQETTGFDMAAPRLNGFWEPLLAVYHKRLLPLIEKQLRNGQQKVSSFFPDARIRIITDQEIKTADPDLLSFFNINTPQDLKQARLLSASARNCNLRKTGASA